MSAPVFKCSDVGPESLELHYYSNRPALGPIVVGVLHGLSERYWGLGRGELGVSLLRSRDDGSDDHEVFRVTYPYQEDLRNWHQPPPRRHAFTVEPDTFYELFPFHILLDRNCTVLQTGAALARLLPGLQTGSLLEEHFLLRHPYVNLEYDKICGEQNNAFLLKSRDTGMELKGQMLPVPVPLHPGTACPAKAEGLLFMGSVRLAGLEDMQHHKLFLSDIPLHDLNRDFVLLAEQRHAEAQLKERFEALSLELKQANAKLEDTTRWLQEERLRSDRLLYQMLPADVATCLKHGERAPASEHEEATILFSDICGFTEISARCSPLEVCALLDELYHQFDTVIEEFPELYKVETIGDAYMVVANVTLPCDNHADLLLEFAVRMHEVARDVRSSLGEPVSIRVGLHSGPVVAGVVGKKMPRFCLFGDTVNTASRMESHGLPGQIHISQACYSCIRVKERFVIRERGNISVKGKGMMRTYLIAPAEQEAHLHSPARRSTSGAFASERYTPSFTTGRSNQLRPQPSWLMSPMRTFSSASMSGASVDALPTHGSDPFEGHAIGIHDSASGTPLVRCVEAQDEVEPAVLATLSRMIIGDVLEREEAERKALESPELHSPAR
ncbi:hypothetical protein GPECTOR_1g220 [Gonium pectorale]|uniref:guanylate cyclase n=1 Tax=Gonium pectorale TaxID=33097 RepID=A0A150H2N1_GONPE|nr:hypothetical protein GPECTOR_1g220 [Gonium pectorale]|eukprot:KXZ56253.1 hypothetical protein GPECTOR_1g220 [Gonium pectorale]